MGGVCYEVNFEYCESIEYYRSACMIMTVAGYEQIKQSNSHSNDDDDDDHNSNNNNNNNNNNNK